MRRFIFCAVLGYVLIKKDPPKLLKFLFYKFPISYRTYAEWIVKQSLLGSSDWMDEVLRQLILVSLK